MTSISRCTAIWMCVVLFAVTHLALQQSLQSMRAVAGLLQDVESVLPLSQKHRDKLVATGEATCFDFRVISVIWLHANCVKLRGTHRNLWLLTFLTKYIHLIDVKWVGLKFQNFIFLAKICARVKWKLYNHGRQGEGLLIGDVWNAGFQRWNLYREAREDASEPY